MRSAFAKDSIRQVKNTLSRFLSILAITALGVSFFAGLRATAPDMRDTAQSYLRGLNFMDVQLLSTAGFTQEDVRAVEGAAGVKDVMPAYTADAILHAKDKSFTVKLQSVETGGAGNTVNKPKITAGRMPQAQDECLADPRFLKSMGLKLGDTVEFRSGSDAPLTGTLKTDRYRIVGFAEDPVYISYDRGTSTVGSGKVDAYFYLPASSFSLPVYTEIDLTVRNAGGYALFSDDYDNKLIRPVTDALSKIAGGREESRFAQMRSEARKQLDDARAKLQQGEQALADGQAALTDAGARITDGQSALDAAARQFTAQIEEGRRKLQDAQASYDAGLAQEQQGEQALSAGFAQYNGGAERLAAAKQQLTQGTAQMISLQGRIGQMTAALQQLTQGSAEYAALTQQLAALTQQYAALSAQLDALRSQLEEQEARLSASYEQLMSKQAELASAKQALAASAAQIGAAQTELAAKRTEGQKQLDGQQARLAEARVQLSKSENGYEAQKAQAQPQLDGARQSIAEGEKAAASLKKPVWYVLGHETNAGFAGFKQDAERIDAISVVFPLLFFLVAALVSLTCMTRMVEDDRSSIGTLKALGYSKGAIARKYLFYAVSASLAGSVAGFLVGFRLFPNVVFNAYRILYTLPSIRASFNVGYAVVSTAAAVFCAAVPAFLVCLRSLQETPASLMRPKAPQSGKRILLERITPLWKRLRFIQKVTARNLFRYKKRLIMTVTGVAGCTALIFTGFGLHDAISAIVARQYGDIRTYQMQIDLKDGESAQSIQELQRFLAGNKNVSGSIGIRQQSADAWKSGVSKSVYLVIPAGGNDFSGYIRLRSRQGHRALTLDDSSVIISEKLASLLHLKIGDTLSLRTSDNRQKDVKIGGIAENYVYHYVYMSAGLYRRLYGKAPAANQLLADIPDSSQQAEDTLSGALMKQQAVSGVSFTTGLKSTFQKMITAVNYVVIVLILSAMVLAFVVLFSLTGINIDERRRELATIKVLGFYEWELAAYIYRENTVLTLIGTALGLLLGVAMERYVVMTSEVDLVMFSRDVLWQSYAYSAALTVAFAVAVNIIMLARIRKIDMVSSLKSAE